MTGHYDVAIIGAGHAGAQAAMTLRSQGFAGSVLLIGDERTLPYDRPSLSKAYMLGSISIERMLLRDADYWAEQKIEVSLGTPAIGLDAGKSMITLSDGRMFSFGDCIIATGGALRTLSCPGAGLTGVHGVRDISDVDAIRADLKPGMSVVIAGAGYVGLEAAAVLRAMNHPVTVIEAQGRVLARVTGPLLSRFVEMTHRVHGVAFHFQEQLAAIEGEDRVERAVLASGKQLSADLVIVGIGITPRTELAERAGLHVEDGVMIDRMGRTSSPHVYAIGDCARHPNSYAGGHCRLESVQHANASAEVAAEAIMGRPRPNDALPTFWSDQYDLRIQSAGLPSPDAACIMRGSAESRSFSLFYIRDGRVIALDAVNCPKDFMAGRALVQNRALVDAARLSDTSIPVKQIAAELAA
jgi:3-phenylpropionate/trans-cinnamate dioxygenase ferredoxin reductase component